MQMKFNIIEKSGIRCAALESEEKAITDVQSALDLLVSAEYEAGTKNIVIGRSSAKIYQLRRPYRDIWGLLQLYKQAAEGFYL